MTRVAIIQGHPDRAPHFGHALAAAYEKAAQEAGHEVRRIDVAGLDFPLLRHQDEWRSGTPVPAIREAQEVISWAEHLVIVFPLWLGDMPALLKAFFEQALRPGFALGEKFRKLLKGRSARVTVESKRSREKWLARMAALGRKAG